MHEGRTIVLLALTLLLLTGCGSTTPDDSGPGDPVGHSCTNTLSGEVTMPTSLAPTGAECDYLLSGTVRVFSVLSIEPGTTIVAAPGSMLDIEDGGRLLAVGTAEERIEFRGSVAAQGSWYGICIGGLHLESRLDFVDIYWAGGVKSAASHVCRAAIGGAFGPGEPVHITNSRIVGSYTSGVDATRFNLGEFRGNLLAGHREYGMRVSPNNMSRLDASTNFGGVGATYSDGSSAANGRQYVALDSKAMDIVDEPDEHQLWPALDVPYYVTRDERPYSQGALFLNEHTATVIQAGAQFVMAPGTRIVLEYGAVLGLAGTPEAPVRFTGESPQAGRWDGFWVSGGVVLAEHAHIQGAGNEGLAMHGAFSFSRVGGPSYCSHLRNVTISGSTAHGVYIDEYHEGSVRLDSMTFENIALDDIYGPNTGPAILDQEPCV